MTKKHLYAAMMAAFPLTSFGQEKLEEVVVTSSRTETPVRQIGTAVSIIDKDALQLQGTAQIADVLRRQAGLSATNTGGAGKPSSVRIRGEEGFRTLVMVDGVEISDPTATQIGPHAHHITNAGDLERIEILRGPQGLMYGADAGGVINMFTQSASEGLHGELSAEGGRYGTSAIKSQVSASNETLDGFISVSDFKTEGFNARTNDNTNEKDGYENQTIHGKFGANLNEQMRLQLVVRDVSGETEYDGFGTNDSLNLFDQTTSRASFTFNSDSVKNTWGISRTDVERESFDDNVSSFSTKGNIQKLDYVGSFAINDILTLTGGSDFKTETLEVENGEDNSRDQLGVFSEVLLNIDDSFYWSSGIRYDDNDDFGEHVSVRFTSAYVYDINNDHTLKFRTSLGTGFRAPSLSEIAYNNREGATPPASEVTLKEENSQGLDIGLDYFWGNKGSLEITFFYQEVKNEISFDLINYTGYLQDSSLSESSGVELSLNMPITNSLDFNSNITHNKTLTNEDTPRLRRPKNQANLGFDLRLMEDALKFSINYRIHRDSLGSINTTQGNPEKIYLDDYDVLDLSASYQVSDWLNVYARAENALDEDYMEVDGYYTSGAAAYAGLRFSF